uniref:Mei2-like C-terminal RNA recognition motif domain-containing protein n=1 Tax=Alexandrium monilatum TaxID=311494 RepID=A0A7S4WH45_9DINO
MMYVGAIPEVSRRPAVVKNTFLEFEDQVEDGDECWLLNDVNMRRQHTDSVVERLSLRTDLEQNLVETLRNQAEATSCGLLTSASSAVPSNTTSKADLRGLPLQTEAPKDAGFEADSTAIWELRQRSSDTEPGPEPVPPAIAQMLLEGSSSDEKSEADVAVPIPNLLLKEQASEAGGCAAMRPTGTEDMVGFPPNCTTVMLRNVPCKYTQRKLLREVNSDGFLGRYDFVYLPMDPRRRANRGFAFFNLLSSEVATEFYNKYHSKRLRVFTADTDLEVLPADIQGYEANAEHYLSVKAERRARDIHSQPLFMRKGAGADAPPGKGAEVRAFQGRRLPPPSAGAQRCPDNKAAQPEALALGVPQMLTQRPMEAVQPMPAPQLWTPPAANMVPRFCTFCGQAKQPDHAFCPFCGNRAVGLESVQPQQQQHQKPPPLRQHQQPCPQHQERTYPQHQEQTYLQHQQHQHQKLQQMSQMVYSVGTNHQGFITF